MRQLFFLNNYLERHHITIFCNLIWLTFSCLVNVLALVLVLALQLAKYSTI